MEAKDVGLIECHGTGTALGDPIEVDALKGVLGEMLGEDGVFSPCFFWVLNHVLVIKTESAGDTKHDRS